MQKKTIVIFIGIFIATCLLIFISYNIWGKNNKNTNSGENNASISFKSFNPFGNKLETDTNTNTEIPNEGSITNTSTPSEGSLDKYVSRFNKITDSAVAGAVFLKEERNVLFESVSFTGGSDTNKNTDIKSNTNNKALEVNKNLATKAKVDLVPSIRYVDRVTGHIYRMYLDTKDIEKISNRTIPNIYEAIFDNTGNKVIYRFLANDNNTILSMLININDIKSAEYLPENITDISINKDNTKVFYINESNNKALGTIRLLSTGGKTQNFSSSFTEWLSSWVNDDNIYLTTKPSYLVAGNTYNLNNKTGSMTKVLGGIYGLTTLPNNDGSMVLLSSSSDIGPTLQIFDIYKHKTESLNTYGLSEKCVWSKDNINIYCALPSKIQKQGYPDIWYKGEVSFDDYFAKINTINKETTVLGAPSSGESIDGIKLFTDENETTLFFINKKDSTLWSLDID